MALLINQEIQLQGGVKCGSIYARFQYTMNQNNDSINANIYLYATKEAFRNGLGELSVLDFHHRSLQIPFNPSNEDVLIKIHEAFVAHLTEENIVKQAVLATENIYQYDEDGGITTVDGKPILLYKTGDHMKNTDGELMYNEVVMKKAFCLQENISITDI